MADETIRVKLEAIGDFSDITKNVNTLQKSFTKLKMPDKMSEGFKKNFSEIDNTVEQIQKKLVDGIKTPGDVAQLEKLFNRLSASAGQISDRFSKGLAKGSIKLNIDGDEEVAKIENQLDDLRSKKIDIGINDEKIQAATKKFLELANHSDAAKKYINQFNQALASGDPTQIESAEKALHKYATSVDNLKKRTGNERVLSQGFRDIIDASGDAQSQIEELTQKVEKLEQELEEVRKVKLDPDANGLSEMGSDLNRATTEMRQFGDAVTEAQRRQQDAASDIENLRNQIKNYFGLDEIFRKIGDAVRDAFETIKELDKAMTETAVVTSFDVGDMWKKLPEYTKEANALGSSISDVYNATTLYYQQGLNTAQSMGLANETLKMARIAGMDAADATDAMTAALRGFNMEVNQASAQKINDVYSKLAADTAADTQEISTAMEKTASIANSAGMEFGTTSAFLSQMIETTREAPENLGTAMKTVIARFQELKKNPLTMVDSEGEFLDRNKVDTALKSIGVSLTDAQGEFRNLDDVFLEISSKWDTLTKSQQRYIATTAAGSRQQSRFIAMMQNYDRTMELVESANNSAGASDEQFSKTLESMDSKLNRLNNAWQEFTMGIANDTFVKFAIDGATTILGLVTKIIDAVSQIGVIDPFKGLIKSGLSMVVMFKALSTGSKLLLKGVDAVADRVIAGKAGTTASTLMQSRMSEEQLAAYEEKQRTQQVNREYYNRRVKAGRIRGESSIQARVNAGKELGFQAQKQNVLNSQEYQQLEQDTVDRHVREAVSQIKTTDEEIQQAATNALLKKLETQKEQITEQMGQGEGGKEYGKVLDRIQNLKTGKGDPELEKTARELRKKEVKEAEETGRQEGKAENEGRRKELLKTQNQTDLQKFLGDNKLQGLDSSQTGTVINGLNSMSNAAQSAGASFQQMGMALAATPLAPVGQAISLIGTSLTGLGGLISSVGGVYTAVQEAMTVASLANADASLVNAAASAVEASGKSLVEIATLAAAASNDEEAISALAAALGIEVEAAAELQAAAAAGTLTAANVTLGGSFKVLGANILKALIPLLPYLAIIAAVVGGAYLLAKAIETPGEKMERLGKAADEASAAVDTTKNALESLNNDLDALKTNEDAFEGLVKGTAEWNSALADNNAQITDLLSKYDTLNEINPETGEYQYIRTDEDGRMTITDEGKARLKQEKTEAKNRAQAVNQIAQARAKAQKTIMSEEYKAAQAEAEVAKTTYKDGRAVIDYEGQRRAQAQKNAMDAQNTALQESAIKSSMATITKDLGLKNEKAITESLTKGYDKLAEKQVLGSKEQNMQEYADYMGYTYKDKKLYSGEDEVEIDDEALKENLKDLKALDSLQNYADELDQTISSQNASFADILKENKVSGKTTETLLGDILSANEETDTDALRKAIDSGAIGEWAAQQKQRSYDTVSDDEKRSLELQLGWSEGSIDSVQEYQSAIDELSQTLKTNAQNLLELDTEHVQAASGALSSAGYSDKAIQGLLEKMGSAQYTALGKNAENIADNIGQKYATQYSKTVGKLYSGNAESQAAGKELQGMFSGVDMSNATDALLAYRTAANSANKSISKLGKQVVNGYKGAEMAATGLQDAYTSLSSEQLKKLQEASASQGGITSTTVQELGVFQNYLDATGMSAGSLANVLNDLTNGSISFDNLTAGVVAFYSELGKANDAVNAASNYGKDFQARDTSTTASFLKEAQTSRGVKREDYYRQIFGADNYDKLLAKNNYNFKKTNNSLADNIDKFMSDDKINVNAVKALAKKKKYDIDAMVKAMQEQYNFTEETAKAIIGGAEGQSDSLRTKFTQKENKKAVKAYEESGQDYAQEMGASIKSLYSYDDMKAIAGKVVGKTEKNKFWETMAEQAKVSPEVIAQLQKEYKGKPSKEYRHALAQYIKDSTNVLLKNGDFTQLDKAYKTNKAGQYVDQSGQVIDGEGITKMFASVAKNQQDADQKTLEYFKKNYKDVEYAGQHFEAADLKNVDTMRAAMERMTDNSQWVTVGKTIGKQIVAEWQHRNDKPTEPTGGETPEGGSSSSSQPNGGGGGSSKEDENPTVEVDTTDLDEKIAKKQEEIKRLKGQDRLTTTEKTQRDAKVAELERELGALKAYKKGRERHQKDNSVTDATRSGETAGRTGGYRKEEKTGHELSENEQKLKDIGTDIGSKIVSALKGEGLNKNTVPTAFDKKENWSGADAIKSGAKATDLTYDAEKARKTIESIDSPIDDWFTGIGDKIKGIFNTGDGEGGIFSGLKSGIDTVKGALKDLPGFNNEPDTTIKVKLNVVGIEPDPVTVPAKLNITGQIEPGGGFLSGILGGSEEGYTVPVTGTLNAKEVKVKGKVTVGAKLADGAIQGIKNQIQNTTATMPVKLQNATPNVSANVSGGAEVQALNDSINSVHGTKVGVSASVSGQPQVDKLIRSLNSLPRSKTVTVSANISWTNASATIKVKGKRVTFDGSGAKGINNQGFGSLASGTSTGRVGPRGRGGLTLTGEEGYEVVWLPNESRSMIVGTNGPQMIDLPQNAVVWDHKQSETILKKNSGLNVGSLAKGTIDAGSAAKKKKGKGKYPQGMTGTEKKERKYPMTYLGNVELASSKLEKLGTTADRLSEQFDKNLEKIGKSLSSLKTSVDKLKTNYKKQETQAKTQLNNAKQLAKYADKSQKRASISFSTKAKNGDDKSLYYKEGALVSRSSSTGLLEINLKNIKKIASKKAKNAYQYNEIYTQLLEAATSYMGEYNDKINSAQDALSEAQEALRELNKQIFETYQGWKNELNAIQRLSKQVEGASSFKGTIESFSSMMTSLTLAGFKNMSDAASDFNRLAEQTLRYTTIALDANTQKLSALRQQIINTWYTGGETLSTKYFETGAERQQAMSLLPKYFSLDQNTMTFLPNSDRIEKDRKDKKISEETYNFLVDFGEEMEGLISDWLSTGSDIASAVGELNDKIVDERSFADDTIQTLIDGYSTEAQKEIDTLNNLNDSLTDAMNDLLDSVERELQKQRQAEENRRTEEDISNQMNRLAILRADTSGGHAVEIAQLEKEIRDATGGYEDTLEDQMLDSLRDQADEASKQREKQIQLLQTQVDYTKSTGQYLQQATALVQAIIDGKATPEQLDDFYRLYAKAKGGENLSQYGLENLTNEAKDAAKHLSNFNTMIEQYTKVINSMLDVVQVASFMGGTNAQQSAIQNVAQDTNNRVDTIKQYRENAGMSAETARKGLESGGVTAANEQRSILSQAGYTKQELHDAFTASDLKATGQYSVQDMKTMGYTVSDMKDAGYTVSDLTKDKVYSSAEVGAAFKGTKITITANNTKYTGTVSDDGKAYYVTSTGKVVSADVSNPQKGVIKKFSQFKPADFTGKAKDYYIKATLNALKKSKQASLKNTSWGSIWPYVKSQVVGKNIRKNALFNNDGTYHYLNGKTTGVNIWDIKAGKKTSRVYSDALKGDKKKAQDKKWLKWAKDKEVGRYYARVLRHSKSWTEKKLKGKGITKFATGGLNTSTGPAWLDGTPSKPELVLNARDTKNFLALKDILSDTMRGASTINNTSGTYQFDIDINVDEIANDYDVKQIASTIEKEIVRKARYRNVNAVSFKR